ncbi:hypothetical protein HDU96_004033, partial [Phlyctochytrium bullatum]
MGLVSLKDHLHSDPQGYLTALLLLLDTPTLCLPSESHQYALMGTLLAELASLSSSSPSPPSYGDYYLVVTDPTAPGWHSNALSPSHLLTATSSDGNPLHGLISLHGPRLEFWFRNGPGSPSSPQRHLVTTSLASLLRLNLPKFHPHGVFLACLDVRYLPLLKPLLDLDPHPDEHPYRVHEHPLPTPLEPRDVREPGDTWRDETLGETLVMDRMRGSDLKQVMGLSTVAYDPAYVERQLEHEPEAGLSRCIRVLSSGDSPAVSPTSETTLTPDTPTTPTTARMASWATFHSNLSVGLLAT